MKFKRKIAGLLAALMVLTLGSVTALADTYDSPSAGDYDSPSADDYYKVRETIEPGMIYVATGTDSKTPWVTIEGTEQVKNLDASVTKALAYKSKLNPNQANEIVVHGANLSSVKISQSNMTTLASRDGFLSINASNGYLYMSVSNGKELNFSVAIKNNDSVTAKLKACGFAKKSCQFNVAGTGKLNGKAQISYKADNYSGSCMGKNGYLYYYDKSSDKLDYIGESFMSDDGTYFFTFWNCKISNAGSYVITEEKLPDTVTTGDVKKWDVTEAADEINGKDIVKDSTIKITGADSKHKVEQKVFDAAKAKGVKLVVESPKNNATFKFSNFDKVSEMSGAFDPTVTIGKSVVKAIDTTMANSKVPYLTVSFAYDGKLPGKTEVALDLSEGGFKDGATVYLYYFNEKTNAFELVDEAKYADGFATFEMEHCSDYIVTAEKLSSSAPATVSTPKATPASKGTAAKNPKTGDTTPIIPLVVVMFVGIAAVVVAFYRKKRA